MQARKRRNREVPLSGSKGTYVVQSREGVRIKIHYRTYRRGGKVRRVLVGPFEV